MKTSWSTVLLAAAGLVVSTAVVDGQTRVGGDVAFSFQTTAGVQPAGRYRMTPTAPGSDMMQLDNMSTGKTVMFAFGHREVGPRDGRARLVFHCNGTDCALAEMWTGAGDGWTFRTPRVKEAQTERVAVVYLHREQSE